MALEYFAESDLRALPDMSDESSVRIAAAEAWIVGIIEREVGTSFVARTVTDEVHDGGCGHMLFLKSPYVLSVTSATENGVAVPADTLRVNKAIVQRFATGSYVPRAWLPGYGNVTVTYEAGFSETPPPDIKEAALQAARWHLIEGRASNVHSPRQTSITNELGGTVNFAVAGTDRPTGYPDVDAVILGWRKQLNSPVVC